MKLNNENFWITGEQFESGESLYEVDILDIYDHKQSTIYYKSGIPEIDKLFGDKGYVKQGYVSTMLSEENGVSIFFCKYWRDQLEELAVAHIQRDKILRFEEAKNQNLEVVKREEAKHKAKYVLKNGTGLLGGLTGVAVEKMGVSANTFNTPGTIYKLYYLDNSQNEKCIEMYSAEEFEDSSQLFLNTYFKSVLSQEAKTPVKESSSCFIATACYKDLYAPEIIAFRSYRDNVLNRHFFGTLFVKLYYQTSPLIYKQLYKSPKMSRAIKIILDKIYHKIQ
jgi:hypothetical protein